MNLVLPTLMVPWTDVSFALSFQRAALSYRKCFSSGWHDSFYWTLRDIMLNDSTDIDRLKAGIDCRQQGFLGVTNVINYIGNHDHDRMLVELGMTIVCSSIVENAHANE